MSDVKPMSDAERFETETLCGAFEHGQAVVLKWKGDSRTASYWYERTKGPLPYATAMYANERLVNMFTHGFQLELARSEVTITLMLRSKVFAV